MPTWAWILIAVAAVVVVAVVVWRALIRRRTGQLQERFGPEYDRTVGATESKREAEAELREREARRDELEITPLSQTARAGYVASWRAVQAEFVDDPAGAVAKADDLIQSVMSERGYPVEDFEQRASDVSVDHTQVVENYRRGHKLAQASAKGDGATEDLRQAMRHYRALFDDLVEPDADQPTARERRGGEAEEATERDPAERTAP